MQNYKLIEQKLKAFIKKYYTNLLIKGALFFVGVSLLIFIFSAALEYGLWLSSAVKTVLFWTLVIVEFILLFKWVIKPASQLFNLSKGLEYDEASDYIGAHFPEVNDKLKNILQLKAQGIDDELILASIEQKSKALKPVPFQMAIDFKQNLTYLRFLAIPILILLAIWVSGFGDKFSYSYQRLVDFKTTYTPPAPFQFSIVNDSLVTEQGQEFELQVQTLGEVRPEEVFLDMDGQLLRMQEKNGVFSYSFSPLQASKRFQFKANQVASEIYTISVLEVPMLKDMRMTLYFPTYTDQKTKVISGTGNASVPEGTLIEWDISTETTDQVTYISERDTLKFAKANSDFNLTQIQKKSKAYSLTTSNIHFENYETLNYSINVVKDEFPKLKLQQEQDSLYQELSYFLGKATDDYGLTRLNLVYYAVDNESNKSKMAIKLSKSNYAEFSYAFPNETLRLEPGETYEYYFEVFDNDEVNGQKSVKSEVYSYRQKTELEEDKDNLKRQNNALEKLSQELEQRKEKAKDIRELQNQQKKKNKLDYTEKQKLENFIKRQKQQMQMMKQYSERLKEDFKKLNSKEQDKQKENLQERLENNQEQIEKNQKLLDELDQLRDKIDQEELNDKLENYEQESQKQEKNLEQLLELTKRFYVEKKTQKLAEELQELAKEQEELSEAEQNSSEEQEELNTAFEELKEELDQLEQKNEDLKSPMSIGSDSSLEEEIEQEQKEAKEALESAEDQPSKSDEQNSDKQKAKQKQKGASEKMKSLAQKMQQSMSASSMQQQAEDVDMLRQILDNLITFSNEQEHLMMEFKNLSNSNPVFASKLRRQAELRENFKHVDDSLYALAMRTPMIKESVNDKISDINFNIDKALERLAENEVNLGTSNQQYSMMFANELANVLDEALDQMQQQMSGSGSGKPQSGDQPGDQLSDIIKSHEELKQQMQQGGKEQGGKEQGGKEQGGKEQGGKEQGGDQQGGKDGEEQSQGTQGERRQGGVEGMSGEIYEIYKQQQELRQQLEDEIKRLGLEKDTHVLSKSLDQLEQELLMKGFSSDLLRQMDAIQHQLLKLEQAAYQQGQDEKREAETNQKEYPSNIKSWEEKAKEYFNTTEILNRQQLPLQPEYKKLINTYFDGRSD